MATNSNDKYAHFEQLGKDIERIVTQGATPEEQAEAADFLKKRRGESAGAPSEPHSTILTGVQWIRGGDSGKTTPSEKPQAASPKLPKRVKRKPRASK